MKRKSFLIAAASSACILSAAHAAEDTDAPIQYHRNGVTVIMHSSTKPINIQEGDNLLGKPKSFTCKSAAGCVVIMAATLYTSVDAFNGSEQTCSFIDGAPGAPGCPNGYGDPAPQVVLRDMAKVGTGEHTVETKMHSLNTRGQIIGWETEYTIYERKVKTTN